MSLPVCIFCLHWVDEDDRVEVEGGEIAHADCAADWSEPDPE